MPAPQAAWKERESGQGWGSHPSEPPQKGRSCCQSRKEVRREGSQERWRAHSWGACRQSLGMEAGRAQWLCPCWLMGIQERPEQGTVREGRSPRTWKGTWLRSFSGSKPSGGTSGNGSWKIQLFHPAKQMHTRLFKGYCSWPQ